MYFLSILWGTTKSIESRRILFVRKSKPVSLMLTSNLNKEDSMVAKASSIKNYEKADAAGKVDIICKNYFNFIGIVDGYTEGLRYMIESEKAYNRRRNYGDLGVRVQASGIHSDITADTAISNVITREAIIACDFSGGVLEGVDRGEEFRQEAYTLRNIIESH